MTVIKKDIWDRLNDFYFRKSRKKIHCIAITKKGKKLQVTDMQINIQFKSQIDTKEIKRRSSLQKDQRTWIDWRKQRQTTDRKLGLPVEQMMSRHLPTWKELLYFNSLNLVFLLKHMWQKVKRRTLHIQFQFDHIWNIVCDEILTCPCFYLRSVTLWGISSRQRCWCFTSSLIYLHEEHDWQRHHTTQHDQKLGPVHASGT